MVLTFRNRIVCKKRHDWHYECELITTILNYVHIFERRIQYEVKVDARIFKEVMPAEMPLLAGGSIFTREDALNYMDLVGIGRAALIEPQFAKKISEGKGDSINQRVTQENLSSLK